MISPATEKKLFFAVALPCIIIFGVLFWGEFFGGMLSLLAIAAVAIITLFYRRRDRRWLRATKVSVVLALAAFGSTVLIVQNPAYWGIQIYRKLDPASILTPNDPSVATLSEHFAAWVQTANFSVDPWWGWANYTNLNNTDSFNYYWINCSTINRITPSLLELAILADFYIRNNTIAWTPDSETWGVTNYIPTPAQVLAGKDYSNASQRTQDDCKGIAVVTVSLLQHLGLNAYVGAGIDHWFTVVQIPGLDSPALFNYWQAVHLWSYFNQQEWRIGQPVDRTISDVLFAYDQSQFLSYFAPFMVSPGLEWVTCLALAAVAFVCLRTPPRRDLLEGESAGTGHSRVAQWFRRVHPFKQSLAGAWIFTLALSFAWWGGISAINFIAQAAPTYTYFVALVFIAIIVRVTDSPRVYQLFGKPFHRGNLGAI